MPSRLIVIAPSADLYVLTLLYCLHNCWQQTYRTYNWSDFAKAQGDVDLVTLGVYQYDAARYLDSGTVFGERGETPTSTWQATDPLVSTSFIPSYPSGWPKTLIMVGTADQLIDSSRSIARTMRESQVDITLVEFAHAVHLFWRLDIFPETHDLFQMYSEFVNA